jgi:drug/metabolite transporter (DMT)-like permease
MFYEIASKLVSESLLSLYPVIVKNLAIPIEMQLWSRFFTYVVISMFFIDPPYIQTNLVSADGILLSVITIAHVYTSYKGFMLLESGMSYTLFYLYPIMILLMSGEPISPIMGLSLLGVYLLYSEKTTEKDETESENKEKDKTDKLNGVIMISLAAFTEAMIYFIVRRLKTTNNWNHIFLSYFPGSLLMTGFLFNQINFKNQNINLSLILNGVIGLVGYLLRFFAISKLSPSVYAPLSYFGVIMAYVYGILINGEQITLMKVLGSLCIVIPNLFLLQ